MPVGKPMTEMSDQQAIADMYRRGQQGFITLHRRYSSRLKKTLMYSAHQLDAETSDEITNDTFLTFYKNIALFEQRCSVFTWLCRLADNEVRHYWQKQNRLKRQIPEKIIQLETVVLPEIVEKDLCFERCMRKAIIQFQQSNESTCLMALKLLVEGLSIYEIAQQLNRTPNATSVFLTACRKKLRKSPLLQRCWQECR